MSCERYYETKGPRGPMSLEGLAQLSKLATQTRQRIAKISFDEDQGQILGRLIELGLPGLLLDLQYAIEEGCDNGAENTDFHRHLCESNAWLRRKWNTAFLLSAIGTLMGVSITLTDPKRTEPVDAIVTHQTVSRTIADAEEAIVDLKTYEAHDFANHFERLLKPYREMADSLAKARSGV
jgi:hypothetical protein